MKRAKNYSEPVSLTGDRLLDCFQFKSQSFNANTEIKPHKHSWGQLNFIDKGVMEVALEGGGKLIAPWQYTIWIPAQVIHASYNKSAMDYCSISVPMAEAEGLPEAACMFELTALSRAIIDEILARNVPVLDKEADLRLVRLLKDLLVSSRPVESYLPLSRDKYLLPILEALQKNPGDNRTLAAWSQRVYTSEKTLTRRFYQELGMSFRDWRIRLRFLRAIILLKSPMSIQEIAWQLGYSHPSSFIHMFSGISGTSPEKYRRMRGCSVAPQ